MSRLQETKRAYDKLSQLLDQEIRKKSGATKDLERMRESLDVAFYLLGWGQFEYLVREEAKLKIDGKARLNSDEGHAWKYLKEHLKEFPVRKRLELIFHSSPGILESLHQDYTLRNEAAHNYKQLPKEAKDVSRWLEELEELVDKFN